MKTNRSLSHKRLLPTAYCLLPTAYCLLPTAYCLLILLLMQVTIINKVNAQVIHGPANQTYVNAISPYIQYNWNISGINNVNYSAVFGATTPGAVNEWANISWNWANLPANTEIVITEEPLFGNYSENIPGPQYPINNINQIPEDIFIQAKIDAIVATGPLGLNGRGTLYLGPGTYYIEEIHLASGVRIEGAGVGVTILKRTDNANKLPNPPNAPLNYSKMLTTYWNPPGTNIYQFSFLALADNLNSSPIEISNLTIDGSIQVNPANFPAYLPAVANVDSWEHSALVYLHTPHAIVPGGIGGYYVRGPNDWSSYL